MFFNYDILNGFYRAKLFGAKFFCIGTTSLGKKIVACHVGSFLGPQILVHGAIHAREHITSLLIFRQIEYFLKHHKGVGGAYFVPIVNPDGVDIAINGTKNIACESWQRHLEKSFGQKGHELFKANANLVDLNVNFDAKWGQGKHNIKSPASENYIGTKPFCENESLAIANFCKQIKPLATISYHSKGEVVYYGFGEKGKEKQSNKKFAKFVANQTGYKMQKSKGSTGGFKDWAIDKLHVPSVTIEVGADDLKHPLTKADLPKILQKNLKLPLLVVEKLVLYDIIKPCKKQF